MRAPAHLTDEDKAFARSLVIVQDSAILALNKPAGLSVQGGRGQFRTLDDLLVTWARSNGKRPQLVHRLDRDTSGVILAAKTRPATSCSPRPSPTPPRAWWTPRCGATRWGGRPIPA